MFIKDGKRFEICNAHTIDDVQYPMQFFAREDNRLSVGVIEIPDPVRGNDDIEYTQEINEAPYVIITPKSQEQLDMQQADKDKRNAEQHLASTDYLFNVDRHTLLLADEPAREAELRVSREAARAVIRKHKLDYPDAR